MQENKRYSVFWTLCTQAWCSGLVTRPPCVEISETIQVSKKICTQLANFQAVLRPRSVPSVSWYSAHSLKYYIISWRSNSDLYKLWPQHHHNRFMALFPGPPGWAGARRELLDFLVQRKINRGRHTDHLAGRHSIRTNQCPPPPSPHSFFTDRTPFLLLNEKCQSTEGH